MIDPREGAITMHEKNLADLYGLDPIPWSRALEALESDQRDTNDTWFLATTRPDGRPHVAGVGAVWDNGKVYVVSGDGTRKSQNLAQNPNCAVGISKPGIDLVIEGTAERVRDDETLQRLAKRYADGGWAPTVKDGAFTHEYSAPSAGPPPWHLYAITPTTIFGVLGQEPGGATRWRFDD
jgi:nitroimidazol reductase NimA-like FMN-containing flavoprotein (pyridoxamine 5'-phosphate oxidase superfamily)